MSSKHTDSKKRNDARPVPACHLCKEKFAYPQQPTPSGICPKCQTKIGVILLVIFIVLAGMVFVGLI